MRAFILAITTGILVAGAAYAHGLGSEPTAQQTAGILTCVTKPEATLVFGRTPVADCTFVAESGGYRQSYLAVFSRAATLAELETTQRVAWRVMTKDGFARPGMLADDFTAPQEQATDRPTLFGRTASLQLLSHSGQSSAKFALAQPRVQLAAARQGRTRGGK
jgi:hypothetical protein